MANAIQLWHGGDLDRYTPGMSQKAGRHNYGVGLYLTDHLNTALKFAKGRRRLYRITLEEGVDIYNAKLKMDAVLTFVNRYAKRRAVKDIIGALNRNSRDGEISAFIVNNILHNEDAISPKNHQHLKYFYVENNIDYEVVIGYGGWQHSKMYVLYNMGKIIKHEVVKRKDLVYS